MGIIAKFLVFLVLFAMVFTANAIYFSDAQQGGSNFLLSAEDEIAAQEDPSEYFALADGNMQSSPNLMLNITHATGFEPDFSNLRIGVVCENNSFGGAYRILSLAPSEWIAIEIAQPADGCQLNIFADSLLPSSTQNFSSAQYQNEFTDAQSQAEETAEQAPNETTQQTPSASAETLNQSSNETDSAAQEAPESAQTPNQSETNETAQQLSNETAQNSPPATSAFAETQAPSSNETNSTEQNNPLQFPNPASNETAQAPASAQEQAANPSSNETEAAQPLQTSPTNESQQGFADISEFINADENKSNFSTFTPLLTEERFNVTFFSGLREDFSNLAVQIDFSGTTMEIPYRVLELAVAQWAYISAPVPTMQHTVSFLAANPDASLQQQDYIDAAVQNAAVQNISESASIAETTLQQTTGIETTAASALSSNASPNETDLQQDEPAGVEPTANETALQNETANEIGNATMVQNQTINATPASAFGLTLYPTQVQNSLPQVRVGRLAKAEEHNTGNWSTFTFQEEAGEEDQYAIVQDSRMFDFSRSDFSISAWFRTNASHEATILSKGDYQIGREYNLLINSEGTLRFYMTDGTTTLDIGTSHAYNDGNWHNAVATRTSNGISLYVDGSLQESTSGAPFDISNNGVFSVGSSMADYEWSGLARYQFEGKIADPKVFDHALSSQEAQELWNAGR